MIRDRYLPALLGLLLIWLLLALGTASAALASPQWLLESTSDTSAAPGSELEYRVEALNLGDAATDGSEIVLTAALPPALHAVDASIATHLFGELIALPCTAGDGSSPVAGASEVRCATNNEVSGFGDGLNFALVSLTAEVESGAAVPSTATTAFEISGGGATDSAATVDPLRISTDAPAYGIDAFDAIAREQSGALSSQAAGHPDSFAAAIDFTTAADPVMGPHFLVEPAHDIAIDLPPGFLGNPAAFARCTISQLANQRGASAEPLCPTDSQLGTVFVRANAQGTPFRALDGPRPVFNLVPPPGVAARFGFNILGTLIVLDARVRSGADYGVTVTSHDTPEALAAIHAATDFWGVPAAPSHDSQRACPGEKAPFENAPSCPSPPGAAQVSFLRNPTACTPPGVGLPITARVDSWFHQGDFDRRTIYTHEPPGYPASPADPSTPWGPAHGPDNCADVSFGPGISVQPTSEAADSPTGLTVDLTMPQRGLSNPGAIAESDLRGAAVRLPQGMSLNPSAAGALAACTTAQVGLTTPIGATHPAFTPDPANCPDAAKLGTLLIDTPLLDHPVQGAAYLATQSDNPFGSLLAMYLIAEDPASGVVLKLPGEIRVDEATGRLETVFDENPQLPFEHLQLELFGGPRAALRTPPTCGTFAVRATFTPWAGNGDVMVNSRDFGITSGPGGSPCPNGGFDPHLSAGTANPLAGATSPFTLRMTREDGTREITGLRTTLPKGLVAYLKGIPYCPDATLAAISHELGTGAGEITSPSCPAASLVGHVSAGAGAGLSPFYTSQGRAYWAGPYHGAPVSLAVVFPAVAGPFDLGNVVIRNGFEVDPETAQITAISDPIPTSLFGIPLDLRDVRVELDRPNYVLNPTSCEPMSFDAIISGSGGTSAIRSERFQVGGCDRLGFKPRLSFRLKGPVKRTANPSLIATLKARPGDANIARAQVKLPPAAFLDNSHIGTVCTRVQFAAQACPQASIYGEASATSPILDYPLYGKVYLRSSNHQLPDLVVALKGPDSQPIEVDLAGKTDSVKGALRNTFEVVPDAPVTKFSLKLFGGKRGLIQMSSGFCSHPRASVKLDAHNGKTYDTSPVVKSDCTGKPRQAHKRRQAHQRTLRA